MAGVVDFILAKPSYYVASGLAGITAAYGLYKAWIYFRIGQDDEYFVRLKTSANPQERRILIIGLDGAGKTRFSRSFCRGRKRLGSTEESTIGFYVNTIKLGEVALNMWDVGGSAGCREYWNQFKTFAYNLDIICYCVDASQPSRFTEARKELHQFLSYEKTKNIPLILIATKQDKPNAVSSATVLQAMNLGKFQDSRPIHTVGVGAPDSRPRKGFMDTYKLFVAVGEKSKKQK